MQTIDILDNSFENWNRITPNFIYNRFDLISGSPLLLQLKSNGHKKLIPVCMNKRKAIAGCWGLEIKRKETEFVTRFLFDSFRIFEIQFQKVVLEDDDGETGWDNDFVVQLPDTSQELENRHTKKGRYNLNRMYRLAENSFGGYSFHGYDKENAEFFEMVSLYFDFKKRTHGTDYHMSEQEYVDKYHVTNLYVLWFGETAVGIVVSCEQCPCVYLENLTYNTDFAKYSPGYMAYDMFLNVLIEKGKEAVFLGGGDLDYKRKYGAIERKVKSMTVYNRKLEARIGMIPENIWGGVLHLKNYLPGNVKHVLRKIKNKI